MSNVLRITSSSVGFDNNNLMQNNNQVSKADAKVQGPVIPDQVVRPDARSDSGSQSDDVAMKFQYQSNFEGFIAQMREEGSVVENFASALMERLTNPTSSAMGQEAGAQVSRLLEMIETTPENMTGVMKEQVDGSLLFRGPFFNGLRQIMEQTRSADLQGGILEFLRRYSDMAEGKHLLNQMNQVLTNLKTGMLSDAKEKLEGMEQQLNMAGNTADTAKNVSILKGQILPMLNQYVSGTNDRGLVRENSALLAGLTARYENGQMDRVAEKLRELMEYPDMQQRFKGMDPENLLNLLIMTEEGKYAKKNRLNKEMASFMQEGVLKGVNLEQKQAFKSAMFSTVLNESVYMPVLHTLVPMKVGERFMLAEMWVDPDSEEGGERAEDGEPVVRGLIKFDISDVGFFDLFFIYSDYKIKLQLNYPEGLQGDSSKIEGQVKNILAQNGIKAEELYFGTSDTSISIEEAFPKIVEGRNTINVKI